VPLINVINGARHAHNNLTLQEYLLIPYGTLSFTQSMECAVEITYALKSLLKKNGKSVQTGDEGGFAPSFTSDVEPFDYIMQAIELAGYSSSDVALGIDAAATGWYNSQTQEYMLGTEKFKAPQLIEFYASLVQNYPIIYLEDGLHEEDWDNWQLLKNKLGESVRIVGDDLLVTQIDRISRAIECKAVNGAIIKLNQVGTVSETLQAVLLCQEAGLVTIASHRSGETCDTFVADFALGVNANYLKCGGCMHGERVAKYNRLIEIESLKY
jgi:enolase